MIEFDRSFIFFMLRYTLFGNDIYKEKPETLNGLETGGIAI